MLQHPVSARTLNAPSPASDTSNSQIDPKLNQNTKLAHLLLTIVVLLYSAYNTYTASTFQISLPEPLQQFVVGQVAELNLDPPDQYFEQLLEEDRQSLCPL